MPPKSSDPIVSPNADEEIFQNRSIPWTDAPLRVKETILSHLLHLQSWTFDIRESTRLFPRETRGPYYNNNNILLASSECRSLGKKIFFAQNRLEIFLYPDDDALELTRQLLCSSCQPPKVGTFFMLEAPPTKGFRRRFERRNVCLEPNLLRDIQHVVFVDVQADENRDGMERSGKWRANCSWRSEVDDWKRARTYKAVCHRHKWAPTPRFWLQYLLLIEIVRQRAGTGPNLQTLELSFTDLNPELYDYCRLVKKYGRSTLRDSETLIQDRMFEMQCDFGGLFVERKLVLRDVPHGLDGQVIYNTFEKALKYAKSYAIIDRHGIPLHSVNGLMVPIGYSDPCAPFPLHLLPMEVQKLILDFAFDNTKTLTPFLEDFFEPDAWADRHGWLGRTTALQLPMVWRETYFKNQADHNTHRRSMEVMRRLYTTCTPITDLLQVCKKFHHFVSQAMYRTLSIVVANPAAMIKYNLGLLFPSEYPTFSWACNYRNMPAWLQQSSMYTDRNLNIYSSPRYQCVKNITIGGDFDSWISVYAKLKMLRSIAELPLNLSTLQVMFYACDGPLLRFIASHIRSEWLASHSSASPSHKPQLIFTKKSSSSTNAALGPRWTISRPPCAPPSKFAVQKIIFQSCAESPSVRYWEMQWLLQTVLTAELGEHAELEWQFGNSLFWRAQMVHSSWNDGISPLMLRMAQLTEEVWEELEELGGGARVCGPHCHDSIFCWED